MKVSQRDIIWADFDFTDGSDSKIRPVLIISNDSLNITNDVIAMKITQTTFNDGFSIPLSPDMIENGSIPNEWSIIRTCNVQSLDNVLFSTHRNQKIPRLTKAAFNKVMERFYELIEE